MVTNIPYDLKSNKTDKTKTIKCCIKLAVDMLQPQQKRPPILRGQLDFGRLFKCGNLFSSNFFWSFSFTFSLILLQWLEPLVPEVECNRQRGLCSAPDNIIFHIMET